MRKHSQIKNQCVKTNTEVDKIINVTRYLIFQAVMVNNCMQLYTSFVTRTCSVVSLSKGKREMGSTDWQICRHWISSSPLPSLMKQFDILHRVRWVGTWRDLHIVTFAFWKLWVLRTAGI
jgi:hypothetical protein